MRARRREIVLVHWLDRAESRIERGSGDLLLQRISALERDSAPHRGLRRLHNDHLAELTRHQGLHWHVIDLSIAALGGSVQVVSRHELI